MPMRKPLRKFARKNGRKRYTKRRNSRPVRTSKKRIYSRKRAAGVKRKVARLSKQVRQLQVIDKATMGVCEFRGKYTDSMEYTGTARRLWKQRTLFNATKMNVFLNKLRYWDPTTGQFEPSSYTTASIRQRMFKIAGQMYAQVKNNQTMDCRVKAYLCTAKGSTSYSPTTLIAASYNDLNIQSVVPVDENNIFFTIKDARQLRDYYHVKFIGAKLMKPGYTFNVKSIIKPFMYDTGETQMTYSKMMRTQFICFEATGIQVVDTNNTAQSTYGPFDLDIIWYEKMQCWYDAGASIRFVEIDNSLPTGVTSVTNRNVPGHYGTVAAVT